MILPKYSHDQHIYKQAMVVLHYRSGEFHHRSVISLPLLILIT